MQGGLLVVLISVWVGLAMGSVVIMEYDVDTIPAISLDAATPVNKVGDIWSNCTQSSDEAEIISVSITPDPPKKGDNVTIKATIMIKENITSGHVEVNVKWSIFHIDKKLDLCTVIHEMGQKGCPIPEGTQTDILNEKIPNAPSGHYTGRATATDQIGKEIFCIEFDFHL